MLLPPDYVVLTGMPISTGTPPLTANPGERIRNYWVLNAGPTTFSAFHVIVRVVDTAYATAIRSNDSTGCNGDDSTGRGLHGRVGYS